MVALHRPCLLRSLPGQYNTDAPTNPVDVKVQRWGAYRVHGALERLRLSGAQEECRSVGVAEHSLAMAPERTHRPLWGDNSSLVTTRESVTGYLASFSFDSCKVHLDPFVVICDSEFTQVSDLINIICQFVNKSRSIKYRRPKEAEIERPCTKLIWLMSCRLAWSQHKSGS